MDKVVQDITRLGPELYLAALGLVVLVADLLLPRSWRKELATVAGLGLALALVPLLALAGAAAAADLSGAFVFDGFGILFKAVFVVAAVLTCLLAAEYLAKVRDGFGEFFALLVFFTLGLCFMASAGNLIVFYLAFELSSICGYLLSAWVRGDAKSNEAGLKYFIYGATASAVMLFGMSVLFGLVGTLTISQIAERLFGTDTFLGAIAAGLTVVGLGYKISMSPFHFWAPDVYEGAPTPVTAFLSVGPKLAGFALFVRVLQPILATAPQAWPAAIAVLSALTMFTGNLLAIRQTNIKRMLAYSSIAHAGYILIGICVVGRDPVGPALAGVMVYAVAYTLMNLGAFGVAILIEHRTASSDIAAFAGLAQRAPGIALAMLVFMLSLTGIPPTAGFVGKLLLFAAAIKAPQFAWLAVVGIINSVISLYYYMNVVRTMYFVSAEGEAAEAAGAHIAVKSAVLVSLVGTLVVGLVPQPIIEAARAALPLIGGL